MKRNCVYAAGAIGLLLSWSVQRVWSQQVPAAGPLATLLPEAAKAGPPAWAKPGTRLVYFGASASVPAAGNQLVLDPHGKWVNKATGERWGEQQVPGAGGAGYSTFQIAYVDKDRVVINSRMYLLHVTTNKTSFSLESAMVANPGCPGDFWVHPDALKNLKELNANGVQVIRGPYTVNNHRYNAVRIQTETNNGYTAYVYDTDTGMLVFHSSSAQGAGILTPPAAGGGLAGVGQGNTLLVTGWLMEVKDVDVPWAKAAPPAWVEKFQELQYRGVQSSAVAGAGQMDRPLTMVIRPKERGSGWIRTEAMVTIQSVGGMPPEQRPSEGAAGSASIGGLWIGPDAIPTLKQGQVIDRSEILQTVTSVTAVGRQVVISEVGPLSRIDWAYDSTTGMLTGANVEQQVGLGRITHRASLVGQR